MPGRATLPLVALQLLLQLLVLHLLLLHRVRRLLLLDCLLL